MSRIVVVAIVAALALLVSACLPQRPQVRGADGQQQPLVAVQPTAVSQPTAAPAPTSAPQPTAAPASVAACRVIHDYGLDLKPEVATSRSHIRVQYWWEGQPERETFIPASAAPGGRFILTQPLRGHVWEFDGCTDEQMRADVEGSIARRRAGGANNAGYVPWKDTGLFRPAVPPS